MWPFNRNTPPQPAPVEPVERKDPVVPAKSTFFAADTDPGELARNRRAYIDEKAFRVRPEHFHASGIAMDDYSPDNFKAAFNMGQQGANQTLLAWYVSQGFIGYQSCAIIAQQWLVDKACSQPGRDAVRKGYEITVNDGEDVPPELLDYIRKADERFGLVKQMEQFSFFKRVFGIRIALFQVDSTDPEYYEKPFNPDGVTPGSYKGISQIDPYWITPELDMAAVTNPESRHFYEPTWWRVSGKRYHRSHLVIIRGSEPADVLKPSYLYGGIPLTQQIYERVYAAERTANEAPQLALTKRTNTIHTDIAAALANQSEFEQRMNQWVYYRDNYGVKILGTDETMEQFDTALGDLDATIMTQYQLVAAIARVPATKLLGTVPKGFNSTGDYEEASYHEELESIQTHDLTPMLSRHHLLLSRSEIASKFGMSPPITVKWNPLDAPTASEKATTNQAKAQTYALLQQAGAIDGYDIRAALIADPESGFNGMELEPVEEPIELEGEPDGITP